MSLHYFLNLWSHCGTFRQLLLSVQSCCEDKVDIEELCTPIAFKYYIVFSLLFHRKGEKLIGLETKTDRLLLFLSLHLHERVCCLFFYFSWWRLHSFNIKNQDQKHLYEEQLLPCPPSSWGRGTKLYEVEKSCDLTTHKGFPFILSSQPFSSPSLFPDISFFSLNFWNLCTFKMRNKGWMNEWIFYYGFIYVKWKKSKVKYYNGWWAIGSLLENVLFMYTTAVNITFLS